ncbi:hypothetical protein PUNSTDRAFT_138088 [Punctularia strigosozonata HHB-11173 SS5]|uniref:Uncharacterized protein n=1 Tax=Punctularia strigosozonata (strain HHB-11173) TaxID=741275 RepID=R7S3A6_PUNST|nr:uncharacterized protein PUNSTDRAFT_138088 [Punctularia strigosozonata HHB-11173 SS5]EIN04890.1 hypothetical protein PUNSTDRAFT_138088 [Punctularia strigosozonata HHB-11173 SS5]
MMYATRTPLSDAELTEILRFGREEGGWTRLPDPTSPSPATIYAPQPRPATNPDTSSNTLHANSIQFPSTPHPLTGRVLDDEDYRPIVAEAEGTSEDVDFPGYYRAAGCLIPLGDPLFSENRLKAPIRAESPPFYPNSIHLLMASDRSYFKTLSAPTTPKPASPDDPHSCTYVIKLVPRDDPRLNGHPFKPSRLPGPGEPVAPHWVNEQTPLLYISEGLFQILSVGFALRPFRESISRFLSQLPTASNYKNSQGSLEYRKNFDEAVDRLREDGIDPYPELLGYYREDGYAIPIGQPPSSDHRVKLPIRATSPPGFPRSIHDLAIAAPLVFRPLSAPSTPRPPESQYHVSRTYVLELVPHGDLRLCGRMLRSSRQPLLGENLSPHHTDDSTPRMYFIEDDFNILVSMTREAQSEASNIDSPENGSPPMTQVQDEELQQALLNGEFPALPDEYYATAGYAIPMGNRPTAPFESKSLFAPPHPPMPRIYRPLSAPTTPDPPARDYPTSCMYTLELVDDRDPRLAGKHLRALYRDSDGSTPASHSVTDETHRLLFSHGLFKLLARVSHQAIRNQAREQELAEMQARRQRLELPDIDMDASDLQGPMRANALVLSPPVPPHLSLPDPLTTLQHAPLAGNKLLRRLDRLRIAEGPAAEDRPPTPRPPMEGIEISVEHRLRFPPTNAILNDPGMPYYRTDGYLIPIGESPTSANRIKIPMRLQTPPGYRGTVHALSQVDPSLFRPMSAPPTPEPAPEDYPTSQRYHLFLDAPRDPAERQSPFSIESSLVPPQDDRPSTRTLRDSDPYLWFDKALFDYLHITYPLADGWSNNINDPATCLPGPEGGDAPELPTVDEETHLAEYDRLTINYPVSTERTTVTPPPSIWRNENDPSNGPVPAFSRSDTTTPASEERPRTPAGRGRSMFRVMYDRICELTEATQFTVAAIATLLSSHASFYRTARTQHEAMQAALSQVLEQVAATSDAVAEYATDHRNFVDRLTGDVLDLQLDINAIRTNVEAWNWTPEDGDEVDVDHILRSSSSSSSDIDISAADYNDLQP